MTAEPTPKRLDNNAFINIDSIQTRAVTITRVFVFPYASTNAFPGVVCI